MRKVMIIAALAMTTGCATTWYKPSGDVAEFNKDEYECQQASYGLGGVSGYGTMYGGAAVGGLSRTGNRTIYMACMRAHGYTTTKP